LVEHRFHEIETQASSVRALTEAAEAAPRNEAYLP
jgi:hypothetical protein